MKEKAFENKIKTFLRERGCWVLKTWSNGVQRAGVPDLLVSCNGYFLGVEVKAENGRPSDLQVYNVLKIRETGGIAIILYPSQWYAFTYLVQRLLIGDIQEARELQEKFERGMKDVLS